MKKSVIISGPQGSGKTHIAEALALQHQSIGPYIVQKRTLNGGDVLKYLKELGFRFNALSKLDILIVDECSLAEIEAIYKLSLAFSMNSVHVVYLTQCNIEMGWIEIEWRSEDFYIINLYK